VKRDRYLWVDRVGIAHRPSSLNGHDTIAWCTSLNLSNYLKKAPGEPYVTCLWCIAEVAR
jgi:hypothetical protein